jgi:sugar lactone lactonase YvrE
MLQEGIRMNRKALFISIVLIALGLVLGSAFLARAQANLPPIQQSAEESLAPEVALGQPGLSYRYVKTFGVTDVAYFADLVHINRPHGLYIDSSNNLFVGEQQGRRFLKYNASGVGQFAIGIAGFCTTDDYGFCQVNDVVTDSVGNIWVADGNRVVQYSATGTFLQQFPATDPWMSGSDNSRFNGVGGVAIYDNGKLLYVSDTYNHRIQVFDLTSGSPVYSTTIGTAGVSGSGANQFNEPYRIAIDGSNRLFVADQMNNRVQRCTYSAGWTCTTLDSSLNHPQGVTIDSSNNIYIADTENARIRKCTSGGACGDFVNNTYWFYDVAVDSSGRVYGAAAYDDIVVRFSSTGTLLGTFVGVEFVPYLTDNYHYNHPRIRIDPSNNILVLESYGMRLLKLDPTGTPLWSFGVNGVDSWDNEHLNWPEGLAADKYGNIYVADTGFCRVKMFSPNGVYQNTLGTGCGSGNYEFDRPVGVTVDGNGNIFVSDDNNHRIQIYNSSRVWIGRIGVTGDCSQANDRLCYPRSVALDAVGNIYVADAGNNRIQKYNSNYQWQMTIGTTGVSGDQFDQFNNPIDIVVDAQGKIYVVDNYNSRIQIFDSSGAYLTTIGGSWGSNSGQLRDKNSVALDSQGYVYVGDFENNRIQVFSPSVPGWKQANINGFGNKYLQTGALEVFNGQLYAGTTDWNNLNAIYRSSDGKTWEQVKDLGYRGSVIDMTVFNGLLYASTGWGADNNAVRILRTSDGTTWNEVVSDGFGNTDNLAMDFLIVFQNKLYATVSSSDSNPKGFSIWRSDSGDAGTWTAVVTGGKGDTNNYVISSMTVYNGYLYAGGGNRVTGTHIWRTSDGTTWNQVNTDGFGNPENYETITLAVFKGNLYAGVYTNQLAYGQIWRSSNGTTWNAVMTDGFGDPNKSDILGLYVFENRLFATANNNVTGTEVWATSDGDHWSQVNIDGWGDSNNGFSSRGNAGANFKNNLFISVMNGGNGGEIWQMLRQVYLPFTKR